MKADGSAAGAPASQRTVRELNRGLVLRAVAAQPGRSRAQLALDLGLAKATMSALADDLVTAGLLVEREPPSGLRGRPAGRLELNPEGASAIGIEIDVDRTLACRLDLAGKVREQRVLEVDNSRCAPGFALRRVARLVSEMAGPDTPLMVGLAFPGLVSSAGIIVRAPNLPRWQGTAPAARLADLLALRTVSVDNEANLAALAEYWYGSRHRHFVHVSGEVGVGGGIVIDGEIFRGRHGFAGELGHITVDPDGPACACGARGCLEQVAGRRAVLAAAGAHDEADLHDRLHRGERRSTAAVQKIATSLATALAGVINLIDVPTIVLGGFYARIGSGLAEPLRAQLAAGVIGNAPIRVEVSRLGGDAPMLGAAAQRINETILTARLPGLD